MWYKTPHLARHSGRSHLQSQTYLYHHSICMRLPPRQLPLQSTYRPSNPSFRLPRQCRSISQPARFVPFSGTGRVSNTRNTEIPTLLSSNVNRLRHTLIQSRNLILIPKMTSNLYTNETPEPIRNSKGLHLITQSTPNGQKVQILLEELKAIYGTEWGTSIINIGTNEQKKDWFLRLNPNGRIPVVIDNDKSFSVMETSAELLYLVDREDKDHHFDFTDPLEKSQLLQWLYFWHGSGAPYQGQVNHFFKYAPAPPDQLQYAQTRFKNETLRVFGVIEIHLSGKYTSQPREYLAGNGAGKYSIADIGTWPWIKGWGFSGALTDEDMEAFPHLLKWIDRIAERPAVKRGVGDDYNAAKRPELYVGDKR
ncbi:hypothetical protein TWF481_007772 [Arthrobotrys musiformis]|uniref:Glutathione S-transferase n=1 Tax=Arthrobotrys musiformis TaxID=47236 RepID=A0AAV9WCM1_9PEZI